MRHWKMAACLAVCAALNAGAAWAGQPTAPDNGENGGSDQAWTVNGMQVIEITPAQWGDVYAVHGDNGELAVTHAPPQQAEPAGD